MGRLSTTESTYLPTSIESSFTNFATNNITLSSGLVLGMAPHFLSIYLCENGQAVLSISQSACA